MGEHSEVVVVLICFLVLNNVVFAGEKSSGFHTNSSTNCSNNSFSNLPQCSTKSVNIDGEYDGKSGNAISCNSSQSTIGDGRNDGCSNSPWLYCIHGLCKCGKNTLDDVIQCSVQKNSSILTSYCITFNDAKGFTETGKCIFHHRELEDAASQYLSIPKKMAELNEFMCGNEFNRTGTLCGKCKEGHYPLAYSFDMNCVQCPNGKSDWWKFVMAAFLPLTIFYLVVLFFKLNVTSSYLYGFVFYSQAVSMPGMARAIVVSVRNRPQFLMAVKCIGSLYAIWNLDFVRFMNLHICLGTDTLQTLALDLVVGFYPLLLMVLSHILIKLHDSNFKPLVFIWKPFSTAFHFRKNWVKTSLIDAFATFFFLSSSKFLSVSLDLLGIVKVYQLNSTGHLTYTWRLYYDATVPYLGHRHLPYALLAIAVLTIFVLSPTLLLILYPFRWFQKLLNKSSINWYVLHTFVDSFYGCYKDGTESGTRDCRWFASMFFLLHFIGMLIAALGSSSMYLPLASMVLILMAILLVVIQPYKEHLKNYTVMNANFILFLALWYVSVQGGISTSMKNQQTRLLFAGISLAVGTLPLFYISAISLQWMYRNRSFGIELVRRIDNWRRGYDLLE